MTVRRFLTTALVCFVVKVGVDFGLRPLFPDSDTHDWLPKAAVWAVVVAALFAIIPGSPKVTRTGS